MAQGLIPLLRRWLGRPADQSRPALGVKANDAADRLEAARQRLRSTITPPEEERPEQGPS